MPFIMQDRDLRHSHCCNTAAHSPFTGKASRPLARHQEHQLYCNCACSKQHPLPTLFKTCPRPHCQFKQTSNKKRHLSAIRASLCNTAQPVCHPAGPHSRQNRSTRHSKPPPGHPMTCADAQGTLQHGPLAVGWRLACCCLLLLLLLVALAVQESTCRQQATPTA